MLKLLSSDKEKKSTYTVVINPFTEFFTETKEQSIKLIKERKYIAKVTGKHIKDKIEEIKKLLFINVIGEPLVQRYEFASRDKQLLLKDKKICIIGEEDSIHIQQNATTATMVDRKIKIHQILHDMSRIQLQEDIGSISKRIDERSDLSTVKTLLTKQQKVIDMITRQNEMFLTLLKQRSSECVLFR